MIPDNQNDHRLLVRWRDFEISASGALGIGGVIVLAVIAYWGRASGLW